MVRGLISERSYPWAVEPAGLNGSIRHRLSGEGSGGELERCLRWGSSWSDCGSGTLASGRCTKMGRWRRSGLIGLVSLKGGLRRVVIRQLRMLGIVGFPIPIYDVQTGTWKMQKASASG